jgi:hypothetical protein
MRRCDEQIGWYQRFSSREWTTRTPPSYGLDDDTALATFVSHIEQIGMTEVSEWQADVQAASPRHPASSGKAPHQSSRIGFGPWRAS